MALSSRRKPPLPSRPVDAVLHASATARIDARISQQVAIERMIVGRPSIVLAPAAKPGMHSPEEMRELLNKAVHDLSAPPAAPAPPGPTPAPAPALVRSLSASKPQRHAPAGPEFGGGSLTAFDDWEHSPRTALLGDGDQHPPGVLAALPFRTWRHDHAAWDAERERQSSGLFYRRSSSRFSSLSRSSSFAERTPRKAPSLKRAATVGAGAGGSDALGAGAPPPAFVTPPRHRADPQRSTTPPGRLIQTV